MISREPIPDFLRGVAIVLMVFGHLTPIGGTAELQYLLKSLIYTFHMPIFIVISGYFFAKGMGDLSKLMGSLRRVGTPYVIFASIYMLALSIAASSGLQTSTSAPQSLPEAFAALFISPLGSFWFLHNLILVNLIGVLCVLAWFRGAGSLTISILALALIVLSLHVAGLRMSFAIFFPLGVLMALGSLPIQSEPRLPTSLIIVCLLSVVIGADLYTGDLTTPEKIAWATSILALINSSFRYLGSNLVGQIFIYLGQNSLAILIFHAFGINLIRLAGEEIIRIEPHGILFSALSVVVAICFSLASSIVLDKLGLSTYILGKGQFYRPYLAGTREIAGLRK